MEETRAVADGDSGDSTGVQVREPLQKPKRRVRLKGNDALSSYFIIFPVISLWPSHGLNYCYVHEYFTAPMAQPGGREASFPKF